MEDRIGLHKCPLPGHRGRFSPGVIKHWEDITLRSKELLRTKRLASQSPVRATILTIVTIILAAADNGKFLLYTRYCVILYEEGTTTIVVL